MVKSNDGRNVFISRNIKNSNTPKENADDEQHQRCSLTQNIKKEMTSKHNFT